MAAAKNEIRPDPTEDWISYVTWERHRSDLLRAGQWHGYLNDAGPLSGKYALVRWTHPTVAVSHDDPGEAVKLAVVLEDHLSDYPATRPELTGRPAPGTHSVPLDASRRA